MMDRPTPYDEDFYAWSREQADVLRGLAERRDLPNALDLEHVIEEIEGVGEERRNAVESFIRLIFVHLMKAACARSDDPKAHWRSEVVGFHTELVSRFTNSMQKDLDLELIWRRAFRQAEAGLKEYGEEISPLLRLGCPIELDELTVEELDIDGILSRVQRLVWKQEGRP
jgi:Domain of unknown function DUF29